MERKKMRESVDGNDRARPEKGERERERKKKRERERERW